LPDQLRTLTTITMTKTKSTKITAATTTEMGRDDAF
jgi:hypothetical protein